MVPGCPVVFKSDFFRKHFSSYFCIFCAILNNTFTPSSRKYHFHCYTYLSLLIYRSNRAVTSYRKTQINTGNTILCREEFTRAFESISEYIYIFVVFASHVHEKYAHSGIKYI